MSNFLQLAAPALASTVVLAVMGFSSLMISLSFHSKSRAMGKLPRNLPARVSSKTFHVFSPYPEKTEMVHGFLALSLPVVITLAGFLVSLVVMTVVVQMGLLTGLLTFILCAALMIMDVSSETHKHANLLLAVFKNNADLGPGDMSVFSMVKEMLPKLRTYYLFLAVVFLAFSIMLSSILPLTVLSFADFLGSIIALGGSGGILGPAFVLLLFVVTVTIFRVAVTKVKTRIFGLPQPETSISLDKPFEAMRTRAGSQYVWEHDQLVRLPPPEETEEGEKAESEAQAPTKD